MPGRFPRLAECQCGTGTGLWPGYAPAGPVDADRAAPGDQIGKGVRFVRELASGAQRSEPWSLPVMLLIMNIRRIAGTLQIKPSGPI